ncbi:MAG: IS66 family transposase [Thermoplasmatales archaeon]|nr:IS66 family transposase [Thermoplasmatales archaeon]
MARFLAETPRDQEEIDRLARENRKLREENERLKREIEEYKKRHPSTVGVKNGKAYFIMDEHPQKEKSNRNPGAQPGHKGHFRRMPHITEHVTLKASEFSCPICSSPLVRKGIRRRVIEDIPPIVPSVIEYKIERMYCRHCKRAFEPDVPNALPGARLSLRTMLITAYLKIGMRMSIENVSTTMEEMFGITISEGEIQDILYQLSDVLGKEYLNLLDDIRRAPSRHIDTTSSRENGMNTDLWVFVTKAEAIFHTARSNNHEVALEILGEHNGTDIHDRYRAFDTLASKTGNPQQYCWAHIISDAKELEEFYGAEGRRIKESLQKIYEEAKGFKGHGKEEDIDHLYEKLTFLLDTGYEHLRTRKFVDNLLKRKKEWLFRFVVDPNVEPTNNRAERALRPSVIYRKVSGGTRSSRGSKAYDTLFSIFYTQKLRKRNFIRDVSQLITRKEIHPS